MSIESHYNPSFVSQLALREKQIQQSYRPIIAVHKWFARRPGSLFRSLILSEYCTDPLDVAYYRPHRLPNITVVDPFMGGGTPLIEANRLGCKTVGYDVNPMSYWIVREELEHIDLSSYAESARRLIAKLTDALGDLYRTKCLECGSSDAVAKYYLWVKQISCPLCREHIDLFPSYVVAKPGRHPRWVVTCRACGQINETQEMHGAPCSRCSADLVATGPAARRKCQCPTCGAVVTYPRPADGPPSHRMYALEYYCPHCAPTHPGRFFKEPDTQDLQRYERAVEIMRVNKDDLIPGDHIQPGDESTRLIQWGYSRYAELFNERQLLGLLTSARLISRLDRPRIRQALTTNLSDLVRYQNMLCRYDSQALKSLDVFSIHGFPVGLVQCESNLLGIETEAGKLVGSGGWANIIRKYAKAKDYCEHPFEVRFRGGRSQRVSLKPEWIGEAKEGKEPREVTLMRADARAVQLAPNSVDAVLTDPPYFGNVQYGELMELCYVWLRQLVRAAGGEDFPDSVRQDGELVGNKTAGRDLAYFADGLSRVFTNMAQALKPTGPLVFTYHHNDLAAYFPVAIAVLDAGLDCTRTFACPAEMGGSIHISNTRSSVVDTVFVCRKNRDHRAQEAVDDESLLAEVVRDLRSVSDAGRTPSQGDVLCTAYGHLTRHVIARLRARWEASKAVEFRLDSVRQAFGDLPSATSVLSATLAAFRGPKE